MNNEGMELLARAINSTSQEHTIGEIEQLPKEFLEKQKWAVWINSAEGYIFDSLEHARIYSLLLQLKQERKEGII